MDGRIWTPSVHGSAPRIRQSGRGFSRGGDKAVVLGGDVFAQLDRHLAEPVSGSREQGLPANTICGSMWALYGVADERAQFQMKGCILASNCCLGHADAGTRDLRLHVGAPQPARSRSRSILFRGKSPRAESYEEIEARLS